MWQRFTERARRAVFFGQEEAASRNQSLVGTEHLLLGILNDGNNRQDAASPAIAPAPLTESVNLAVRLLEESGVTRAALRQSLLERMPPLADAPENPSDMQLSLQSKKAIDLAYDEAKAFDNNYLGTEHLLLGILNEPDGLGGIVLRGAGVTADAFRTRIRRIQNEKNDGNPFAPTMNAPHGFLRVPPAPSGREPMPNAKLQPAFALELSDAQIVAMEELLARQEVKAYAEILTGRARVELPPDTEVEILDHAAPLVEYWRKVRILSGDKAGEILFVPLSFVRAAPDAANPSAAATLPDARKSPAKI